MINTKPKISIIIPIYNAEAYLPKCLNSIVNQSQKNIEIICVNDGSTDGSLQIIENYAKVDSRIKIINQMNSGTATARNTGLKMAKADYLWFIDADDWIELDSVDILQKYIDSDEPDLIGFIGDTSNSISGKVSIDEFRDLSLIPDVFFNRTFDFINGKDFLFLLPLEVWSRIFKRSFLNEFNITFESKIYCIDDGLFLNECFLKAKKIFYTKDILYHYRTGNALSLVHSLTKSDPKKYHSTILYSTKCDELIHKHNFINFNFEPLILRNVDRMLHVFLKLKGQVKKKFYLELQSYIKNTELTKKSFIQKNNCYHFLLKIQNSNYWMFKAKNFLFYKFDSSTLSRIAILGMPVYKKQIKPNIIKSRIVFSLIKKIIKLKNNKIVSLKYYFAGIPIYIFIDKTQNTN